MKAFLQQYKWLMLYGLALLGSARYLQHTGQLKAIVDAGWPIGLLTGLPLSLSLWLITIDYFRKQNHLNAILKPTLFNLPRHPTKSQKVILLGNLLSTIILPIVLSLLSSALYGLLFPSPEKKILRNTTALVQGQKEIKSGFSETSKKIDELLQQAGLDPRDVERYLKDLPLKNGERKTREKIQEWYDGRKISATEKELLFVAVTAIYKYNKELSAEIEKLKAEGNSELALFLETIQKYLEEGNAAKIRDEYRLLEKQIEAEAKQKKIKALKESIKATQALFAIEATKDLYTKLLTLEPTAKNYFNCAYFLQKQNSFSDAGDYYENALKKYREQEKENPDAFLPDVAMTLNNLAILHKAKHEYEAALNAFNEALSIYRQLARRNPDAFLPDVAMTLNNLANLHSDKHEYEAALNAYNEALEIRRQLARRNPDAFLPDVAMTLNNLAVLHSDKHEYEAALNAYNEALSIYRQLAKVNPSVYDIDYANTLTMGVVLLNQDKTNLKEAKRLLEKYPHVYRAQELLKIIQELE